MKSDKRQMNLCYAEKCSNFNKLQTSCHSMNNNNYKIIYRDFFKNKDNVLLERELAEEALFADAEDIFVDWLKEWNG